MEKLEEPMKVKQLDYENIEINYPIEKITDRERILFLDIETTGFTARVSNLYMIGCAYYQNERYHMIQWFAETPEEEETILKAFLEFSSGFTYLVHFNGNNFDIPYLIDKCKKYALVFHIECFDGLDLYRRVSPLKQFLKLSNCKQRTIEEFLQIFREDPFPGGKLIDVYHNYVKNPDEQAYETLSLHNAEDILGMIRILPILAYSDLLCEPLRITKAQGNYYHDMNGRQCQELLMTLSLQTPLPIRISYGVNGIYFTGEGTEGSLRVPLLQEELKYFYANYKDYYYLPEEDLALHKSVSGFVDSAHRKQATAQTCYTRKVSLFLEEWGDAFRPVFKKSYQDKSCYFELTDPMKTDREFFSRYASHVIEHLVMMK